MSIFRSHQKFLFCILYWAFLYQIAVFKTNHDQNIHIQIIVCTIKKIHVCNFTLDDTYYYYCLIL